MLKVVADLHRYRGADTGEAVDHGSESAPDRVAQLKCYFQFSRAACALKEITIAPIPARISGLFWLDYFGASRRQHCRACGASINVPARAVAPTPHIQKAARVEDFYRRS
jgi:hypothetical protein